MNGIERGWRGLWRRCSGRAEFFCPLSRWRERVRVRVRQLEYATPHPGFARPLLHRDVRMSRAHGCAGAAPAGRGEELNSAGRFGASDVLTRARVDADVLAFVDEQRHANR